MKPIILFFLFASSAHASDIYDIAVTQHWGCIGIDRIPIATGTSTYQKCCSGDNLKPDASDDCRAGFSSLSVNSAENSYIGLELANNELEQVKFFDGQEVDVKEWNRNELGSTDKEPSSTNSPSSLTASSAMINGGEGTMTGATKPGKGGLASGKSGSIHSAGVGSSGNASGAFSSGDLFGGDGNSSAKREKSASESDGSSGAEGSNVKYVSSAGTNAARAADGSMGSVEGALKDDIDLTQGADGSNGASGSLNGGVIDSDEDGDLVHANATSEDPSDYFKRIDKSASIFKIVSARYMKKKSLWNRPQKPQDQLKPKKI